MRRFCVFPRRYGNSLRIHSAGQSQYFDDDDAPAGGALTAMYAAVGEEQGVPFEKLRGTVQTDILKEYIAQKEWAFPPEDPPAHYSGISWYFARIKCPTGTTSASPGITSGRREPARCRRLAFTLADGFSYGGTAREKRRTRRGFLRAAVLVFLQSVTWIFSRK